MTFVKRLSLTSLFGLAAIVAGFMMANSSLQEGSNRLAKLDSIMGKVVVYEDPSKMKDLNEKLVIVSGTVTPHSDLTDPEFNLAIPALKLLRESQIYQWHKWGAKPVHIEKVWRETPLPSPDREHVNQGVISYPSRFVAAQEIDIVQDGVKLAALEPSYNQFIGGEVKLMLSDDQYRNLPPAMRIRFDLVNGSLVEKSTAAGDARIGDNRTRFRMVPPYQATVVGVLVDGKVISYDRSMDKVGMFMPGKLSPSEMRHEIAKRIRIESMLSLAPLGILLLLAGVFMTIKDFSRARRTREREQVREVVRFGR